MFSNSSLEMAINLHQQGFFEKAEEIYLQLLERHPEEKEIIYFFALIAIETNNNLIATNWFQQYLSVDQKNSDRYYLLGNLFKEENQFDKAIQAYQQAIAIDASRPEYYNNLGNLLYATFDDTRAYKAFEKAIILAPNFTEAYCGLARILLNTGEFETAISIC